MQPAQPSFPDGAADALQQHTVALEAAVQTARQQQAAYMAALNTAQPTGHAIAAVSAAVNASSLNQGMAAASKQWGDPNARLDSMLNEMVAFKLKQRAPTIKRKPTKSITSPVTSSAQPLKQSASANGGQSTRNGSDNLDGQWELVSTPGQADGSEQQLPDTATDSTQTQQQLDGSIQPTSSAAVDGEEYELYYEEEDGEAEGEPPYNEEELGMDAGALEQVLELRLQLHDLDVENNALKQQLEQQKKLMAQLQASLLMGAPSTSDNKETAITPAATDPAAGTPIAQHTDDNTNSSQHDTTSAPTLRAPMKVSLPEAAGVNVTGSGPDSLAGFDALAAAPRGTLSSPTAKPPTTPEPTQMHTAVPEHAAPQSPTPQLNTLHAVYQSNSSASSASTTAVSQQAYHLAPGVDILEGLGLAHHPQKPPTPFQPSLHAPLHQDHEHPPVARTPSEGELAAIKAVQEYESQHVQSPRQPVIHTATVVATGHAQIQHPVSPSGVHPATQPHYTASYPAAHTTAAAAVTQSHPVYPSIVSAPHTYAYHPHAYPAAAHQYSVNHDWSAYNAAQYGAHPNAGAGPTGGWGSSPYTTPYLYQTPATTAYTQTPYTQYQATHYGPAAHTTAAATPPVATPHAPPQPAYTPTPPQATYPLQATGAQTWQSPVTRAAAQSPPPPSPPAVVSTVQRSSTPAPPVAAAAAAAPSWICQVCTYEHTGRESTYLRCAICNAQK